MSGDSTPPEDFFRWGEQLAAVVGRIHSLTHWEQVEGQVSGLVGQVVRALDRGLGGDLGALWHGWRERYLRALGTALGEFRRQAARRSESATRAEAIDPALPTERRGESLSRKALWMLASTPAVSTVLVGLRREADVDDALGILCWAPLPEVRPVYEAIRRLRPPRP